MCTRLLKVWPQIHQDVIHHRNLIATKPSFFDNGCHGTSKTCIICALRRAAASCTAAREQGTMLQKWMLTNLGSVTAGRIYTKEFFFLIAFAQCAPSTKVPILSRHCLFIKSFIFCTSFWACGNVNQSACSHPEGKHFGTLSIKRPFKYK